MFRQTVAVPDDELSHRQGSPIEASHLFPIGLSIVVFVVVVFVVVVIVVGEREGTDRGRPLIFRSVCRSELETAALLNY